MFTIKSSTLAGGCWKQNGNCSHICFERDGKVVCKCGVGYELQNDQKTCFNSNISFKILFKIFI